MNRTLHSENRGDGASAAPEPFLGNPSRRVRLAISLSAIRDNFRHIAERTAPCRVMAVLKANAYGIGVEPVARCLKEAGAACFGAAEMSEALSLLPLGLPVHILGALLPEEIPPAVAAGVVIPVGDRETARAVSREACRQEKRAVVHFLVDTGMGRLGIPVDQALDLILYASGLPGLDREGIYTHFPAAYRAGEAGTRDQVRVFTSLLRAAASREIEFPVRHVANSDAINNYPETYREPFNLVRTGINLYGCFDVEGARTMNLRSALRLTSRLVAVRRLPAGMSLGYGRTYTLPRETRVGTVSAGYADGLPLALSNRGYVLVRNRVCPVLGRVSMDYTTVSLEQVPEAEAGDPVTCLGGEGATAVSVDDWAALKGTNPYDIICSIGGRVARCTE